METRRLGRTEHFSSLAILGGAAFWGCTEEEAARAFEASLAAGVNHLDVAPQYGKAEELLGPHVGAHREELFVACKTQRRNAEGVRAQLETSLARLECDAFDLYQLHAVTSLEDLESRADALEVIMAARDEGLCRFIGITGHDMGTAAAQREALRRYDLDTVMLPVNPRMLADPQYRSDFEALVEEAESRDVGIMAIKATAARPWGDTERWATSWYEPHRQVADLERGVRFALSTPGVVAIPTPGDLKVLIETLEIVNRFEPMDSDERERAILEAAGEPLIFPIAEHA